MSLEDRVETLEHELKILKNEIESTLLEIQNQVLVHYYPAFRAEETVSSRDQLPFVEVPLAAKRAVQGKENGSNRGGIDVEYVQPKTREVSLDVITGKPDKLSPLLQQPTTRFKREVVALDDDDEDAADEDVAPDVALNQAALSHLARWVNDSVAKVGKDRTQEMIDSWVGTAQGMPAIIDALRQLLDLSDEVDPPEPVSTKELMDVLLKFNKMVDQVTKVIAAS